MAGTGIAPEHLPKIFDIFYTTKTSGKGTGLGLYTCKKIIEEYGGTISVDTQLGKGTKFTITIPVK
jgi:signal transduction histidine kinase